MQLRLSEFMKKMLITYVAVYLLQVLTRHFGGGFVDDWFALNPLGQTSNFQIWQFFTYNFLHADVMHLVFNMLILVFIGGEIEAIWGTRRMLIFYSLCSVTVGLVYFVFQLVLGVGYNSLMGASGGIYGLMMVYAILFPERELLFMMMFPLKTKHFVMLISAIEFLQLASSPRSGGGLGAIAHLSGLGAGWVFLRLQAKGFKLDFERKLKSSTSTKKRSNHLKLVQDRDEDDRNNKGPKTWH